MSRQLAELTIEALAEIYFDELECNNIGNHLTVKYYLTSQIHSPASKDLYISSPFYLSGKTM